MKKKVLIILIVLLVIAGLAGIFLYQYYVQTTPVLVLPEEETVSNPYGNVTPVQSTTGDTTSSSTSSSEISTQTTSEQIIEVAQDFLTAYYTLNSDENNVMDYGAYFETYEPYLDEEGKTNLAINRTGGEGAGVTVNYNVDLHTNPMSIKVACCTPSGSQAQVLALSAVSSTTGNNYTSYMGRLALLDMRHTDEGWKVRDIIQELYLDWDEDLLGFFS